MNGVPLVSVLIPAFEAAPWIAATLESVVGQTWPNLDIVVVDDGSNDETATIARGFASRRVTVIRQDHRNASSARNRALTYALGDYIQFLDADDLLAPDKIEIQVAALQASDPRAVASCPWARFSTGLADARFVRERDWRSQSALDFLLNCAFERLTLPVHSWLIPRRVCDEAGPWDERLSTNDDGEYFARVVGKSSGVLFCEGTSVYYRSNLATSYGRRDTLEAAHSDLLAWRLIAATMLKLEDSPRVQRAVATGYQRLQARYYRRFDGVVAEAARLERAHGRGAHRFEGGPLFRFARHVFGWRAALRLRHLKAGFGRRTASRREPRSLQPGVAGSDE